MSSSPPLKRIRDGFSALQTRICACLADLDGSGSFEVDHWRRQGGGGGCSRILQNGALIEKGGVNYAFVHGAVSKTMQERFDLKGKRFAATGLSIVLHAQNPFVPIIHMNLRYFELNTGEHWFGGGIDLTPHYLCLKEAKQFHHTLEQLCKAHTIADYQRYKAWADDYFFLPHRHETRGIGGIFFDRIGKAPQTTEAFRFVSALGEAFYPLYASIVKPKRDLPYTQTQKEWQNARRGRYVEFNLLYDLGTRFGLESNGRIESILMSLPPQATWPYQPKPSKNSPEANTLKYLKKGITWNTLSY